MKRGLFELMKALDTQIARRMQRSPAEREVRGVQKWGPYEDKTEEVSVMVLDAIADGQIQLDSLLILSRSFSKCLKLVVEELGPDALGELRSSYCEKVFEAIEEDARRGAESISSTTRLM